MYDDTIAAISTAVGEGGIGIVRLSGASAFAILGRIFTRPRGGRLQAGRLMYGHARDPATGENVDEVLASYMPAPRTYTREDVVEIDCHGGMVALQRVLELALREGARLAGPGEFTLRAFLNGRIDLSQAESVIDVVRAQTEASLRVAVRQLEGGLAREVRTVRAQVLDILAYLTATVDFTEDEIPPQDLAAPLQEVVARVEKLLSGADAGIVYRQGVRTAIVGRPNVGKSSLLNALLREARAIVTAVPGTTRDTVEEVVNIQGVPIVLIDTAGITATDDVVERMGVERSRRAIEEADLVLLVVDGSQPLEDRDRVIARLAGPKPALLVVNKSDLPQHPEEQRLVQFAAGRANVRVSATEGSGLPELEDAIVSIVFAGATRASDALLVSNPRHKDALNRARSSLKAAAGGLSEGTPADCLTVDLTAAANALGEITGETVGEDLLHAIFSRFCIGK